MVTPPEHAGTLPGRFDRPRPRMLATFALALACAGWAALFLHAEPGVRVLVPGVFAAGIVTMSRWPVLGASAICLAQGAGLALGAPAESPAGLLAGLSSMVILGRRSRLPRALLPVLLAWAVIVATDITPVRQVLGLSLFAAGYGVGYTLRKSAELAGLAEAEARDLEAEEVASRAREALVTEHRRLTVRSSRLLRTAAVEMRELARAARTSLDAEALARLRERGDVAVDELRMLLGLLRDPEHPAHADAPRPQRPPPAPAPSWHTDASAAAVLLALAVLEWTAASGQTTHPTWLALTVGSVALHRSWPTVACVGAAAGLAAQWATGTGFVLGPALAVAIILVVWSAVGAIDPVPSPAGDTTADLSRVVARPTGAGAGPATGVRLAGILLLAGAGTLATAPAQDGSLEVWLAIVLGTALSSRVWHRTRAKHEAARRRSATYTRRVAMAIEAAIQQERLAVARDVHDVASGAIGVMLLHTSAAQITRDTDPAAARRALDAVVTAGDDALGDLDRLERALGPGPVPGETTDLRTALTELTDRMSGTGLRIGLEVVTEPHLPAVAAVTWRVVSECLTNALKHAPGSRVDINVRHEADELVVRVHNDGAAGGALGTGTGLGLHGLREQVEQRSGTLRSGPLAPPDEGFEVVARLPDGAPALRREATA